MALNNLLFPLSFKCNPSTKSVMLIFDSPSYKFATGILISFPSSIIFLAYLMKSSDFLSFHILSFIIPGVIKIIEVFLFLF